MKKSYRDQSNFWLNYGVNSRSENFFRGLRMPRKLLTYGDTGASNVSEHPAIVTDGLMETWCLQNPFDTGVNPLYYFDLNSMRRHGKVACQSMDVVVDEALLTLRLEVDCVTEKGGVDCADRGFN